MARRPDADAELLALQEALAGRFSIERELGRGGMGIVYLAQDVALDRPVALKLLPPAMAAQPSLRERFLREARTAARLSHPHIVPIHLVDEVGDFVFFVMAFVEGETLGQRVRARGPVDPREATRILREVAWALAYAHAQGLVHRDVKPDNILLEAGSGRALVTDFGIAHGGAEAGLTSVGEVLGTPEYMSPEQASGAELDGRSDLYALGVVAHYMVSGEVPFQGHTPQATLARHLTQPAPALAKVAPEVPAPLAEAIDRCLAKEPADRFRGGEDLADVLGRALQERREVPAAIRAFQEQNRESAGALAVATMLVLMIGTIVFIVVADGGEPIGDMLPGMVFGGMLATLPVAMLGAMARRLLKAGYGRDELVRGLRADVEDRRRELAAHGGDETALDVWAPRAAWVGVLLFVLAIVAGFALFPAIPDLLIQVLAFTGIPLAVLGGGTAAVRGSMRRAVAGSRWLAFWDSPLGAALFGLAGVGLDRTPALGGSYRPTEIAIGMAAERLFAELPKDVRRPLGDLPAVVEALEAHAASMRERIRDLDRVLVDVGEDAPAPGPAARERRDSVAEEVREARAAAEGRLREVVAALENIRLELLRLHAGSGTVESLTADLGTARALAGDLGLLVEGRREVDAMFGRVPDTPEPDTPVPA